MKKYLLIIAVVFSTLLLISNRRVNAQTGSMMGDKNIVTQTQTDGEMHAESVETVLQILLDQQKVSSIPQLDLSKISDDDWERLGDAVMEVQHPGESHEIMDQMMGGEGSESLSQMHINIGKAYLSYGGSYTPGMMGSSMMGNWNNNRSLKRGGHPIMGYGTNFSAHGVLCGLTWVALIAFLVAGVYFFIKQAQKK